MYTPFYCNATRVEEDPESCAGGWYVAAHLWMLEITVTDLVLDADMHRPYIRSFLRQSGFSDGGLPIVTSVGQNPATGNILPQLFFRFRGVSPGSWVSDDAEIV